MAEVIFEDKNQYDPFEDWKLPEKKRNGVILEYALKLPFIKNKRDAYILLISLSVLGIAISIFIFMRSAPNFNKDTGPQYRYIEDIPLHERDQYPQQILDSLPSRYPK